MIRASSGVYYLELSDIQYAVYKLISGQKEYSEDMPPFETRYPGRLESIIEQIQAIYFGEELYKDIPTKAAVLFYLMNKNHPFINGNKRISVYCLIWLSAINVQELFISQEKLDNDLTEMAIKTAASKLEEMDSILAYLKEKIASFIIAY